ncbi:helix-turn-helix domain-containing protein [Streptomyces sp. MBT55]|uniref:helix-turn-helix domain-containing protein n=1 Tax=Streptomyces sp. MBT55 TaxID=1488386 RepID=UPI001914AC2B|nr:helix-turn-helix domain-containing protein [Streptomyces sp. MBT55]MBK6040825.1 helix-turn-helix domain-containing protein [Streptomyces sp. MBT55]
MRPDVGGAARRLLREDGSVLIPAVLADPVLRILLRDVSARVAVDGGKVAPGVSGLLWALKAAADQAEAEAGSAPGTPAERPVSVEISTAEAARELGCSEGYVRRLVRAGRLRGRKVGPVWLVAEAAIVAPETERAA